MGFTPLRKYLEMPRVLKKKNGDIVLCLDKGEIGFLPEPSINATNLASKLKYRPGIWIDIPAERSLL